MLNLRDNKPLNNKLEEIIYHGDQHGAAEWQMSAADLKNKDFITANRNSVIRAMIYQWFKQRFVKTLSDADIARARQMGWLRRIESADGVEWLQRALENGKDVYDFVPEKFDDSVRNEIVSIRDFLYSACDAYLNKELNKEKINLRLSYLTTINEYDTYDNVRDLSDKWHKSRQAKAVNQAKMREGAELFMQLPNGYNVWRLMTAEALDNESDVMGHCVGNGGYDAGVQNGTTQIYSLRDRSDTSHVTFEIRDGKIMQCKGTANTRPIKKYVLYIYEFIKQTGFEPAHDLANMHLVKDKAGKIWSIYDLPENLEVRELDLSETDDVKIPAGLRCMWLSLAGAKNITLPENLEVELLDLSETDGVKIPAGLRCRRLFLKDAKNITLPENLEVEELHLSETDGVKIPAGLRCMWLSLKGAKNITLPENLEVEQLDLSETDGVKIPSGLKCRSLDLSYVTNFTLSKNLEVEELILYGADADNIKILSDIKFKKLTVSHARNITLPKNLEVEELYLSDTRGVKIPAGLRCRKLCLAGAKNFTLPKNVEVEELVLKGADDMKILSDIKFKKLSVWYARNIILPENLEVEELGLFVTDGVKIPSSLKCKKLDLSSAKNITLPKNLEVEELDLSGTDGVTIPAGVKYKRLRTDGATNWKIEAMSPRDKFNHAIGKMREKMLQLIGRKNRSSKE